MPRRLRSHPVARLAAAALACLAARAHAQTPTEGVFTVDVGAARVRQAGTAGLTAPSAGAGVAVARGGALVRAAGAVAAADGRGASQVEAGGEWALGGAARGALGAPRGPLVRADAELRAARVPNTPWAVLALAGLRADVPLGAAGHAGAWVRAQAGASRQAGGTSPSAAGELGAWRAAGAGGRVIASLALAGAARVTERGLVAAGVNAYGPAGVGTGDAVAGFERAGAGGEFALAAGVRAYLPRGLRALPADDADPASPGAALRWRAQASAAGVAWLAPAVGVTGAAGLAPNDPVRGLPAAAYAAVGLRVRARTRPNPGPGARPAARVPLGPVPPAGVGAVEPLAIDVAPAPGGDAAAPRRVTVQAPAAARRVQLRGDATGWRAVDLARDAGGHWAAVIALAPGPHRVQVRVDGGAWAVPANLPAVDDELVGPAGLLVAP